MRIPSRPIEKIHREFVLPCGTRVNVYSPRKHKEQETHLLFDFRRKKQ